MKTIEKDYLENQFATPIVLVTYDGNVRIEKKVVVKKYTLLGLGQKPVEKLELMFVFPFEDYEAIKVGITHNQKIAAQKLRQIAKVKDRPIIATKEAYLKAVGKHVKITMRTGHILSGKQICATQYDLLVKINEKIILVYKHGIFAYEVDTDAQ